jgi:hypothetical protein
VFFLVRRLITTGATCGNPQIVMLAWARRVLQIDDLNQKLELSRIYTVEPPLAKSELFNAIPDKYKRYLKQDSQQTERHWQGPA